ncbi:MAG: hypothetical protein IT191_08735 [Microbacteriaceae bacterium]|nr:hypothetical protein [Cryobacterium sp.]MCC6377090.1 hypothetical protein [Microbacteriaceae bacterium]
MARQPRVDKQDWDDVLAYRPAGQQRAEVRDRLAASGVTPETLSRVLADGGDELNARATMATKDWADPFGGPLAAALLAAEVSALSAHLNSRAANVRARAVEDLLDEVSVVAVASHLGVSRQKVYELGRARLGANFIDRVPWRKP